MVIKRRTTSIVFAENQLFPGLIGLSPLITDHPQLLQQHMVRPSSACYRTFSLSMTRSPGFGSNPCNLVALFRLAFATPTPIGLSLLHRLTRWPIIQEVRRHDSSFRRFLIAPTACRHSVSDTISLPLSGCFSPFPHGTCSLSVTEEYLGLEGGPPMFKQDFTCPALLEDLLCFYPYGTFTHYGLPFQTVLVLHKRPLACSAFARHY